MFPTAERCRPSSETGNIKILFSNHLGALQKQVIDISKSDWIRNTLAANDL